MTFNFCILVFSLAIVQVTVQKSTRDSPTYVAAVVEYSPDIYDITENDVLTQNAKQYVDLIRNASKQEADIIVFPECGLATIRCSINDSSVIPDPNDEANPCGNTSLAVHEAIRTLSCAARDNDIYVVVNIPEKKPCSQTSPSNCTTLHYNTDVVFDRQGVIIARYRKYNLFGEPEYNTTDIPEAVTFETDFGVKFGIFTCFDIMFEKPAVTLVKEYGVTDVVFPTAWFSELPFHSAVQEQAAWASGLSVNLLASGYNNPLGGNTGSGIFARQRILTSIMANASTTQLLVATVPKTTSKNIMFPSKSPTIKSAASKSGITFLRDYLKPYTMKSVVDGTINEKICHGSLCCTFTGRLKKSSAAGYRYKLSVFDGVRPVYYDRTLGIQVCAVIFCANDSLESCGAVLNESDAFSTSFESLEISGVFELANATQFPNTLVQGYDALSSDYYKFLRKEDKENNVVAVVMEITSPKALSSLLTFGIFGRNFLRDGQPADNGSNTISQSLITAGICLVVAIVIKKIL